MAESPVSKDVREKGIRLFRGDCVKKDIDTERRVHFVVKGDSGKYSVIFDKDRNVWSCDCRFGSMKGRECSHIYASKLAMGKK